MPVNAYDCPCTDQDTRKIGCDLAECSSNTKLNALCEADRTLPDGNPDYDVDNCPGTYDVFRRINTGNLLNGTIVLVYWYSRLT